MNGMINRRIYYRYLIIQLQIALSHATLYLFL